MNHAITDNAPLNPFLILVQRTSADALWKQIPRDERAVIDDLLTPIMRRAIFGTASIEVTELPKMPRSTSRSIRRHLRRLGFLDRRSRLTAVALSVVYWRTNSAWRWHG